MILEPHTTTMQEEVDVEYLITLVSERPVLWDKTLEVHKSRLLTTEAWTEVCTELNDDYENMTAKKKIAYGVLVAKKWKNIRDQWMKSVKKAAEQEKSGGKAVKNYIYHEQLSFLKTSAILKEEETTNEVENIDIDIQNLETVDNNSNKRTREDENMPSSSTDGGYRGKFDVELKLLERLQAEDRNLSFFRGLLPSLKDLNDGEMLDFQSGVIKLIQNIKNDRIEIIYFKGGASVSP